MKDYKAALSKKPSAAARRYAKGFNGKPSSIPPPKPLRKIVLNKKELWALYGLNRPPKPRYEGLKGVYWHVVSEYVRKRDFMMWEGRCISCGKKAQGWAQFQAGHFVAAGTCGFALLFDLENINAECGYCNGFDQNHLIGYERNLDSRYGKGTAEHLKARYFKSRHGTPQKAWGDKQYDKAIRELQGELMNFKHDHLSSREGLVD